MAKKPGSDSFQILKDQMKAKQYEKLYFFTGEETYLLHYYLQEIKKKLIDDLTESFNYHLFNAETFDLREFISATQNYPMMSERTLTVVDDVDIFAMDSEKKEHLSEALRDIPDYCTVIFLFQTVALKQEKKCQALADTIKTCALQVEFAKQDEHHLIAWICKHFATDHKRISNDLCQYLIEITGGTMNALLGEIDKITAYSESDEICKADIDAVVEPVLDAVVFQMTESLTQRDYAGALQKLQTLLKMQQEPLSILGAVGTHFRRLSSAVILRRSGKGVRELMDLCGIQEYPAKKIVAAATRLSDDYCSRALTAIMETDFRIKTSYDDPQRLLEKLLLELALLEKQHG